MAIKSLQIIGETLTYGIPRIKKLLNLAYQTGNFGSIQEIAQKQERQGASYLDIIIGELPAQMMASTTRAVQEAVNIPLCFDSDDVSKLEKGLLAYDDSKGIPILNSANESRINEVLSLRQHKDCQVVLQVAQRGGRDSLALNTCGEDAYRTARRLYYRALNHGFQANQVYIDPGTPPIGADEKGLVNMTLDTIEKVNSDPEMKGVHTLIGITNLTIDLPPSLKLGLQNAFLTLAVEKGLDTIIGNPERKYEILEKENPFLQALQKVLDSENKLKTFMSEVFPLMRRKA
jgi:5-methyltetrahydrofolate--homocysteine methyltransferase